MNLKQREIKSTKPSNFNKPATKPLDTSARYELIRQAAERIQGERQDSIKFEWQ